jgi:hypothetical protein
MILTSELMVEKYAVWTKGKERRGVPPVLGESFTNICRYILV